MRLRNGVKPDPGVWLPLLEEYSLSTLPFDTVLQGVLREGLHPTSPEVTAVLAEWPSSAHLHHEDGLTELVAVYPARDERGRGPWVHLLLFAITVMTTLGAGALMTGHDPFRTGVWLIGGVSIPYPGGISLPALALGAPFALPFLGVMLAHEMGHYVAARVHRVRATLPYFIPFPPYFSIIGTVGAFIRLKGPTVRRSILFDIGAAGPIASFLISLPLFVGGLLLSEVAGGRAAPETPFFVLFMGEPVWLGTGALTHALALWFGPSGLGEVPILLHPAALAGWLGLFVTALNLLPLGQLDGGHVLFALAPERQKRAARLFMLALLPLGLVWWGWWGWAVLILFIHRGRIHHPDVVQPRIDLDPSRRLLAWALIAVFFLTFVPVPIGI